MARISDLDPTLYGGPEVPFDGPVRGTGGVVDTGRQLEHGGNTLNVLDTTQQAQEVRQQQALLQRPVATIGESIAAAASQFSFVAGYKAVTEASYTPDPNFNFGDAVLQIPFELDETELDFMKSQSAPEFMAKLDKVKQYRQVSQTMGDHPLISAAIGMVDPGWLALDAVGLGAAHAARVGKLGAAAIAGAGGAALGSVEATQRPMAFREIAAQAALNAAAVAVVFKGKKAVPRDKGQPTSELRKQADVLAGDTPLPPTPDATVARTMLGDTAADFMGPPIPKTPAAPPTIAGGATELLEQGTPGVASALYWNTHKTLAKWNPRVADLVVDNNSNLGINSVESIHRAVRADLHQMQYVAEDLLSKEMARQGASHWKRIVSPVKSAQIQQRLSANVSAEMWVREQAERLGQQYVSRASKEVQQIADAYEAVAQRAYNEMKDAGVQGMEGVTAKRGWMRRQWNVTAIENMEERLVAKGFTTEKAHQAVVRMVAASLRRANTTLDDITAYDIGATIINRAKRKGYFEDSMFEMHQGNKVLKEVRDELELSGMPQDRIQRVMAVLEGKNNEAGKPGFLKHRMDLDYKQGMIVDGELFRVTDLLDNNIATITERYLDGVSARVAFTKSGLPNATAIDNLKAELLHSTPAAERRGAEELFDNIVASLEGRPAGQAVNDTLRKVQQVTRMVSLGNSGIYQLTEMAVTMARYGMLTSVKHLIKEMPGARKLFNPTPETARSLKNVLTAMSTQDIRLRPYIHKFEDNFHIDPNDATHLRLQVAGQLVPYINAMKYVHGMQAKMTAGVIVDRVNAALRGEAKALKAVEKYGINAQVLEKVRSGVSKGGMNVDAWGDDAWDAVRPALAKMMDEAVLRARIGDVPAFAKFNEVGKFIFTFRSFVLSAHNKILAGTLDREGIHGLSLLMLYQYPLAALATQSIKVASGQEPLSTDKLVMATVSNMGAVGLISELAGVISGEKRNFGSPGTLLVDRMYKLAGSTASAIDPESKTTGGDVAAQVASLIPLAGIFYPVKNIAQGLKEGE